MGYLHSLFVSRKQKNPTRGARVGFVDRGSLFVLRGVRFPAAEADLALGFHDAFADMDGSFARVDVHKPALVLVVRADDDCLVKAG